MLTTNSTYSDKSWSYLPSGNISTGATTAGNVKKDVNHAALPEAGAGFGIMYANSPLIPQIMPFEEGSLLQSQLNELYKKVLGVDSGGCSEADLLEGVRKSLLAEIDKTVILNPAATGAGSQTVSSWDSDYSVSNVYLALLKMAVVMSETNQELVELQQSLVSINNGLLTALKAKGEAQTKQLDDIQKEIQHLLHKIKKLGIFGKLAVGLVSMISELAGCVSAVATGNVASFGANALAAYNSTAQVLAGTLLLTMGEANKLLENCMGFEVNIGESFLEDVETSGFFFFAGDHAGAIISEAITTAALTSGVLAELNMAVEMVRTATQTSVEVSVKMVQRLLLNFVTVASDAVGLGFHYQAMVASFRHQNQGSGEIDAQTVTANFGAAMGLLMFILEKTTAVDQLATVLGETGMGKDCGKMLTGYMLMIVMGLLKSRVAYGQYQDKQALDAMAVNSTPSSLATKYQGTAIPSQLLASMDKTILKISDSFRRISGNGVVNHDLLRFMGYSITVLMLNMQLTNAVESCDSTLGSATMQKGSGETMVVKDTYSANERLYQSLISDNNNMSQQLSQVIVGNIEILKKFYASLGNSTLNHSVSN